MHWEAQLLIARDDGTGSPQWQPEAPIIPSRPPEPPAEPGGGAHLPAWDPGASSRLGRLAHNSKGSCGEFNAYLAPYTSTAFNTAKI